MRRLLWERPNTAMEQQVISRGRVALPMAWAALASESDERRAAAAALARIRDVLSIPQIVTALSRSPGALTREQLLFDLNLIVLTEGTPADNVQSRALAAAHLPWVYEQIMSPAFDAELSELVRACATVAVLSEQMPDGFSLQLGTATARAQSIAAFRSAVAQNGCGIALHAMSVAADTARVGATLYLPQRPPGYSWVAVYRRQGGAWVRFEKPNSPRVGWLVESSVKPAIWRDYGTDEPLKLPRLDLEMERVRVGGMATYDGAGGVLGLATTDAPLLERYRRSDSLDVRYVAEREHARLTRQVNMSFWLPAFVASPSPLYERVAIDVISDEAARQIAARPGEATGADRDRLVAAALAPNAVKPHLLPQRLPRLSEIGRVRQSADYGLIEVSEGDRGYSMLFRRRGDAWEYLFVTARWIE